jgi:hypothetical protein
MASTFRQVGGARIGFFNATWPFVWLSATPDGLSLWCGLRFTFPTERIRRLSWHKGVMSTGLRIEHSVPRYPAFFVFWTFDFPALKQELETLGHEVHDPLA